jgi:hypothetical protein
MKVSRFLTVISIVLAGMYTAASGNDSTSTAVPDSLKSPTKLIVADSIAVPDAFVSFSAMNKKYLKKAIITNILYLGGFGLYQGVVIPGINKADNTADQLKWAPLSYLSVGMMYASIPINVISSCRARNNYKYYYKTAPTNFTLPIMFMGAGLCIGSVGGSLWNSISDYRDNKELDQSYDKYGKLSSGLFTAGLITFAGSNLYSLVYTIMLGEKAKQHSASTTTSLHLAPMRYGDAYGGMLTWDFKH